MMFYSNDEEDFKKVIPFMEKLEEDDYELAFATDNVHLVRALSIGHLLVVNPNTYHYSVVVTNNKSFKNSISFKDFLEVMSS